MEEDQTITCSSAKRKERLGKEKDGCHISLCEDSSVRSTLRLRNTSRAIV